MEVRVVEGKEEINDEYHDFFPKDSHFANLSHPLSKEKQTTKNLSLTLIF